MFKLPTKTEFMKAQMDHEPTRAYAEEIYNVVKEFPFKHALEIGSAWGISALAILTAQKGHLTCVDPNLNIELPNEMKANGIERYTWDCRKSNSFWEDKNEGFDLIYIDGSHLYEDFKSDVYNAWESLRPNGLIMWDDFTHPNNLKADPTNGQAEYGISLGSWEFIRDKKITKIHTTERLIYVYKNEQ